MEIAKPEMSFAEDAAEGSARNDTRELTELQLALVGGGFADPIIA